MSNEGKMKKLALLDSNSLLNRAYYAIRPLSSPDGKPTNAVFGYLNMLLKLIADYKPTHIIATFDMRAPTFRKEMYADYKAGRKPMPEDLALQLPIIKEVLSALDIKIVEKEGFEADDLIGTLAKKCEYDTIVVTGDKDSLQLISDSTTVLLTKKGISEIVEYTPARLKEDGLTPSQIIDLKSLMGDASDNIPGVPGVGEKTAMTLIAEYGTLDNIYENIDKINGKLKDKLVENKELAYLSYRLATIDSDVDIEYIEDESVLQPVFKAKAEEILNNLGLKTIVSRLEFEGVEKKPTHESVDICKVSELNELINKVLESDNVAIYDGQNYEIALDNSTNYLLKPRESLLIEGLEWSLIEETVQRILSRESLHKYVYDAKRLMRKFGKFNNFDDISVKAYVSNSIGNNKNFKELAESKGYEEAAASLFAINNDVEEIIVKYDMTALYNEIELPLVSVLFDMENSGFTVDINVLKELQTRFTDELNAITEEIYAVAGSRDFNINSTKQLGELLYGRLGLMHGKKSKSGGFSTNIDALNAIQDAHPIVPLILKYREVSKLLSTYINGVLPLLKGDKLHSILNQTVTATGRLSSTEPNLQNIPIRKAIGREIRKMFVASKGNVLISADYSQIELRLLAHLSGDGELIDAFVRGDDVHASTASKVFGVDIDMVTPDMRRRAKAVNFGIIYGISDYGLSEDIGCSVAEARRFIEKYFVTYPFVKKYLDSAVEFARMNGYQQTICGRIRFLPDIKSANYNVRSFNERVAMNMPMQGSASDIIKIAMINVVSALETRGLKAKLIMQVHDELIIDCPVDERDVVKQLLKESMENAAVLEVPLIVELGEGSTWYDA